MILNYKDLKDLIFLKCNKFLADYFIYVCKLPLFSVDEKYYVFLYSEDLIKNIDDMNNEYKDILSVDSNWLEIKDLL